LRRYVAEVHNTLLDLRSFVLRKKSSLKKRGKALCFDNRKISEIFCFESMNLSMFNRFCPSLKARAQLKERVDLSKFNGNEERYIINMDRKSFLTNKWMQEPRILFTDCRSNTMILEEMHNP
jgi:hypothetical protein